MGPGEISVKFFARLLFVCSLFAIFGGMSSASAQYYHRPHRRYYHHRPYHRPYYRPHHRPYRRY